MPDTLEHVIRTTPAAGFCNVDSDAMNPLRLLVVGMISMLATRRTVFISRYPMALEKRPAATRYNTHVETIRKA
jgi:hypothetical protein